MTALVVTRCGPMTSLQDGGRIGWQRYGITTSGAMDRLALATANALVGNAPGAGAIEFALVGGTFTVEGGVVRLALVGASCALTCDGAPVAPATSFRLEPGRMLTVGPAEAGVYAYLAVAGGFALPLALGSLSLHARAGIGGLSGRALQAGDRLPLNLSEAAAGPDLSLPPPPLDAQAPIRIVLGPQDDHFTPAGLATFLGETFRVSREADRMGYRLSGPRIEHARGANIVSDGIVAGSVQVSGSGEPIVMMADRQTTGGYPKIATVVSADLRRLAQRRTGQAVRFRSVTVEEGQRLARELARECAALAARARPLGGLPPLEELLSLNLAGDAVDARAPDGPG
jgi:biotin-dependent carboxylase-like uncharacterized protein